MGRRPKPTAVKLATGNAGKRKLNANEPVTSGELVAPPHLTDRAREAWFYIVPILLRRKLAGDMDVWALERLCEVYAEIIELMKVVGDGGHTYECETESGATMQRARPEVAMLADADRRFKSLLVEFGMTPAARSKVQVADPDQKAQSPAAKYFGQAG